MDRITAPLRFLTDRQPTAALLLLLALQACAGPRPPQLPEAERPPPPGAVRVRLAFPEHVDIDLYVTGPSQETVYFGNPVAGDGGRLDADRRCGSPGPRLETVLYPDAAPGLYRVGVDFPERCAGATDRAPFALEWQAPGGAAQRLQGEIDFGHLEVRVLEFRVEAQPVRSSAR